MLASSASKVNPNPITKIIATIILGYTVVHKISPYFEYLTLILIATMFYINGLKKEAVRGILAYSLLSMLPSLAMINDMMPLFKMFISILIVFKMFYLPYFSARFMVKTSDVGSIISSMDRIKVPSAISIPLAVMFRFFPSFKEEKENIKLAMKIRGISIKNPIMYLEYIAVPLLVISSNIADDISKAAETRCIENPVKKTRYLETRLGAVDIIYILLVLVLVIGGKYA